jgi:DNA-binding MarR family transcriptional regulator
VDDLFEMELVKTMILMKQVYADLLRPFGIETPQWHALLRLAEGDGPSQSELGERLVRNKVAITRLVAGLEKKGLVKRESDPSDSRKQRIFLTTAAKRLFPAILDERDRLTARVATRLSPRDQAAMRRSLRALQEGFRAVQQSMVTELEPERRHAR